MILARRRDLGIARKAGGGERGFCIACIIARAHAADAVSTIGAVIAMFALDTIFMLIFGADVDPLQLDADARPEEYAFADESDDKKTRVTQKILSGRPLLFFLD